MKMTSYSFVVMIMALLAATLPTSAQTPAGMAFTYQGQLKDGGSPANGSYDFEFALYDAATDGNQVVSPVAVEDQEVNTGLFTVQLDFGSNVFTGQARWLDVAVRPGDSTDAYTPLMPRQLITAAPYALGLIFPFAGETQTSSFEEAAFSVVNNGMGPAAAFSTSASPAVFATSTGLGATVFSINTGPGEAGSFIISNPSSAAPALLAMTNGVGPAGYFDGSAYFTGNVGIGVSGTPDLGAKLTITHEGSDQTHGNSSVYITQANTYFDNEAGIVIRGTGPGWGTRFTSTDNMDDTNGQIVGIYKEETNPGDVANESGGEPIASFNNNGNVGIGTSGPSAKLTIDNVGSDQSFGNSAVYIGGGNRYLDYAGGLVMRGSGPGYATLFTSTGNMDPNGLIVGIYKEEANPGDVANGSGQQIATFMNNGNVGIGTGDPAYPLDVNGIIRTTGGIRFPDGTQQDTAATSSSPLTLGPRGVQEFSSPGDHEWTAPLGVHRVMLELWGASGGGGGGGGGGYGHLTGDPPVFVSGGNGGIGGGGGAGAYIKTVLDVTPGEIYTVRIGQGGTGGSGGGIQSSGQSGQSGTPSQLLLDSDILLEALAGTAGHGGTGASGATNGADGAGGAGGQANPVTGIARTGGNGGGFPANTPGLGGCGSVSLPNPSNRTWPGASGGVGGPAGFGQFSSGGSPSPGQNGAPGTDGLAVLQW